MKAFKFIYKTLLNLITLMLILCAFISVSSFINSAKNKNYVTGVGSYRFLTVLSGSMSPTFNTYDMIIDKVVDINSIKQGDVITYRDGNLLVTHRVIEIIEKDDSRYFKTKGDANNVEDLAEVPSGKVIGIYSFRIPYMGLIVSRLRGEAGFYVLGVLLIYISITEIYWSIRDWNKQRYIPRYLTKIGKKGPYY